MEIVFSDVNLGVRGTNFAYIFSYQTMGLESFKKNGKEWLFRAPKPTFWRATTCNDRGSGFPIKSSAWLGADLFIKAVDFEITVDGTTFSKESVIAPNNTALLKSAHTKAKEVSILYKYETTTFIPVSVTVKYTVTESGNINVSFDYFGEKGLPELPTLGLRFILPFSVDSFNYLGLSGETYPDRMKGGIRGEYEIKGTPVSQYIVPQECGMHMDSERLTVKKGGDSITITQDKHPFPFSILPYTALEMESAYHQDELPQTGRTVLCVYAAVRGVGGINSWGADVEKSAHIEADKNYSLSFNII